MSKEISDILNNAIVVISLGGSAVLLGAAAYTAYKTVKAHVNAPKITQSILDTYNENVSVEELKESYNQLLPASRRCHRQLRNKANTLLGDMEMRLLTEIINESQNNNISFQDSRTYIDTFAKHGYGVEAKHYVSDKILKIVLQKK